MQTRRRLFLKAFMALSLAGSGLLTTMRALAAWPKAAFEAKSEADVLKSLFGDLTVLPTEDINIKVAKVAENGSSVPVSVETNITDIDSISIVAPNNPLPLAAHFEHGKNIEGYASVRIKMAKSGDVVAVVKSKDTLYTTRRTVKVTLGGCGG